MARFITYTALIIITVLYVFLGRTLFQHMEDDYDLKMRRADEECKRVLDFCLQIAVDEELQKRIASLEVNLKTFFNPYKGYDTIVIPPPSPTYVVKTITTMDTTFQVKIEKDDIGAIFMIQQYIMKHFLPVNLTNLEWQLRNGLQARHILPDRCFLEYIDIKRNSVTNYSVDSSKPSDYIASDFLPIDILETVGVKAYIPKDHPPFCEAKKDDIRFKAIILVIMYITILFVFFLIK